MRLVGAFFVRFYLQVCALSALRPLVIGEHRLDLCGYPVALVGVCRPPCCGRWAPSPRSVLLER
ncbi:MAG: hypothetical protein QM765_35755 [Myxococcales bacterium]